jgi:hypothetical protein
VVSRKRKYNRFNHTRRAMNMKNVTIFPPTMAAIGQALDLFGEKRVVTGEWNEAITVSGLTESEVAYAVKFFKELGCEVRPAQETRTRSASVSRDVQLFA